MKPGMLIAYDAAGDIVATLDHLVARDASGAAVGLVDFVAHEEAGGEHTDIWQDSDASGSKVWPEWIGVHAYAFRVELAGPPGHKHIAALVHKASGYRRERAAVEAAIEAVAPDANGARDIRALVGGPTRPLHLDDQGRTVHPEAGTPSHLPVGRSTP